MSLTIKQLASRVQQITDYIGTEGISKRLIKAAETSIDELKHEYGLIKEEYPDLFKMIDDFCKEYKDMNSPKVFTVYPCDYMPLYTNVEGMFIPNEDLADYDPEEIQAIDLTVMLALTDTSVSDQNLLDGQILHEEDKVTPLEGLLRRAGYSKLADYTHYYTINWLSDLRQAYCASHLPLNNDNIVPQ